VVDGSVRYDGGCPAGVVEGWEKRERLLPFGVLGEPSVPGSRKDMVVSACDELVVYVEVLKRVD